MNDQDEYRRRAEEAEHWARKAISDAERAAFLKVAAGWRQLEATARRRAGRDG